MNRLISRGTYIRYIRYNTKTTLQTPQLVSTNQHLLIDEPKELYDQQTQPNVNVEDTVEIQQLDLEERKKILNKNIPLL